MTTSDADARFDRTIDRWFRDQLAMRPETATFLGVHDHDGELSSGGRDAIDDEIASSAARSTSSRGSIPAS
jgi:hypothetical protein